VLSLLENPHTALMEFWRVLHSGGYLILSDMYSRDVADGSLQGMASRGTVEEGLSASGFETLLWEDHTPMLKELAARLILAGGSLEGFRCTANSAGQRPGYYLLVARKE
jgi:ubiquinone/menaquinone biosynthesis C-methylase UbiE